MPDWVLLVSILLLLALSAYFAGSETAMMKLNPYRLQSLANQRHGGARRASKLLERKDRLLGVILIGNNLVNFSAVVIANVLFIRWFGTEIGGVVTTVTTTFTFLIFAEIAPKSIAAERPESIAFPSAYVLVPLQAVLKYVVIFINFCGAFIVKPFTKNHTSDDSLSEEELRTIFDTSSKIPQARQAMFSRLLDLEEIRVADVMVPREKMVVIDIGLPDTEIHDLIEKTRHTRLPVVKDTRNNILGILHMRDSYNQLQALKEESHEWGQYLEPPAYVPSSVSIGRQLRNFNEKKYRFGVAVDEYGDIVGVITIEDIITTVIGNFMDDEHSIDDDLPELFEKQPNGSYRVSGKIRIHELNHRVNWHLPEDGPRTISGLVLSQLRGVPAGATSLIIDGYQVEVVSVDERGVTEAIIQQQASDEIDKEESDSAEEIQNDS